MYTLNYFLVVGVVEFMVIALFSVPSYSMSCKQSSPREKAEFEVVGDVPEDLTCGICAKVSIYTAIHFLPS